MGCISFPSHPVWEITTACNLRCIHCHASGGQPAPDELSTREGKRLLDDLAQVDAFRIMVYTGGEPLTRPDIFELLDYSHKLGFVNLLATNATLIDEATARRLRQVGVVGAAVGLDGPSAETHNRIRNTPDAFQRAMAGIQALQKAGILLQINVTAMAHNVDVLEDLIEFSDNLHVSLLLMYQLATIGRGHEIAAASFDQAENEGFLHLLSIKIR
ncbi:MAG TPA: radical SAM protein [Chloroflexi bacterium]|nr:radical SAM protein [Chloroflexota bacterium]